MNGLEPDKSSPILVPNLADRHAKPSLRRSFSKICTAGCILPLAQTRSPALNGASRVISSVGRALRLHRRCREFEPLTTHHFPACCVPFDRLPQGVSRPTPARFAVSLGREFEPLTTQYVLSLNALVAKVSEGMLYLSPERIIRVL